MQVVNVTQGSPEWHAHRAKYFNASDAPAMMGCSPYETRDQLLARLSTGITPEVDAATQRRFDEGHRIEALARKAAEKIVGEDLFPVTGTDGAALSASFDGLTMDESTVWECKTLNKELRECMLSEGGVMHVSVGVQVLPLCYRVQMEQQLMVSGADRALFTASDGTEHRHCWYYSDSELRSNICGGWALFRGDLENYKPAEPRPQVAVEAVVLPAVSLSVSGALTVTGNLPELHKLAAAYIERLPMKPQTDQDFAKLEQAVKVLKDTEGKLEAAEANALAQTASVEEMRRLVATIMGDMRNARLAAEKLVKTGKDARKLAIITAAKKALHEFEEPLQTRTRHHLPVDDADWQGVTRGLKTLESFQGKVNDELARCKVMQMQEANRIERCLKLLDDAGMPSLFPDVGMLVTKQPDDLAAIIAQRKAKHEQDVAEAARREAERKAAHPQVLDKAPAPNSAIGQAMQRAAPGMTYGRPTESQIIAVLALHFRAHESRVIEWLLASDWATASEELATNI